MLPAARFQPNLDCQQSDKSSPTKRSEMQNALIYISQFTYLKLQGHQLVVNSASIMSVEFDN